MIICLTGIDGCGKGTQKELLKVHLENSGKAVFISKAYGDAEKECFSAFIEYWTQESILFLFQALHVEQRMKAEKALTRGDIVIADRWDESYLAYHSTHGILSSNPCLREQLNSIAFGGIIPDVTFFLNVSVDKARERMLSRGMDFFDRLSNDYHSTMRNEYLSIATDRKWVVIDGTKSPLEIHRGILRELGL